jgi:very-short-patch-repair endonuclease
MKKAFRQVSYPEQYIGLACKNTFNRVELNKKMANGMEADIAIWDIDTIIEYNGVYWHIPERDERKKQFIEATGTRLIRIWDTNATSKSKAYAKIISENDIVFNRCDRDMTPVIPLVNKLLGVELVISDNMENEVIEFVNKNLRDQCLAVQYPEVAKELLEGDPYKIVVSDTRSRKWKCSTCGTVFNSNAYARTYGKHKCPACAGNIAIPGKTDILTVLPGYASEIISLTEEEKRNTLPISTVEVTWCCTKCHHTWQGKIGKRTQAKTACPKCGYIPEEINRDDFVDINYLRDVNKPIEQMMIFGKIFKVDLSDAIGAIVYGLLGSNTLDDIVDKADLHNIRTGAPNISYNKDEFRIPKKVAMINGKNIYIEGDSATMHKVTLLKSIIDTFNIESKFKIKEEYKLPSRVSLAKDKVHYNAFTRINGKVTYIGRRSTVEEALRLKLSAEIYFFGHILISTDIDLLKDKSIPDFKEVAEYEKFKNKYTVIKPEK